MSGREELFQFGGWLAAGVATAAVPAHAEVQAWRFHAPAVLGTSLDVVAVARSRSDALAAADAVRGEIARLDRVLSGWRADSELAALNRAGRMAASDDLLRVIAACERWRALSGGAFDARRGALYAAWREGRVVERAAELGEVGFDGRTIVRPAGVRFAPEALAKGYVVDRALCAGRAAAPGLQGLMVDIGGDLRGWGRGPAGDWVAGVADPDEAADNAAPAVLVRLTGRALAVSGRGPRDLRLAEGAASHVIGPDGRPAGAVRQAAAIAPEAADADALATALCAMSPAAGIALAERLPGMEARVVDASGGVHATSGWERLVVRSPEAPPRLIRAADAAAQPWPAGFQVRIDYVLPDKGPRAYAPYVAIWVTDEANRLVRALTMLGRKLDYVNENYIWWRRFGRAHPELVAAVGRPTRHAGRYQLAWDGKDDMGRPVGQGRYTIHVEAAREKGLHSYQSIDLVLGADPAQGMGEAGEELGPTLVRYGRR